jgi:type II secretory pathway pseudopilin PulG
VSPEVAVVVIAVVLVLLLVAAGRFDEWRDDRRRERRFRKELRIKDEWDHRSGS